MGGQAGRQTEKKTVRQAGWYVERLLPPRRDRERVRQTDRQVAGFLPDFSYTALKNPVSKFSLCQPNLKIAKTVDFGGH